MELAVQVNGKLRGTLRLPVGLAKDAAEAAALADPAVARWASREKLVKTVLIPDKLINLVVRP